jgi:hypothetical protein
MMMYQGGAQLGNAAAGLMGAQDPELQRISSRQKLLQGINPADPQSLKAAAQQAAQAGDIPAAQELITRAQALEKAAADTALAAARTKQAEAAASRENAQKLPPDVLKAQRIAALRTGLQTLKGIENPSEEVSTTVKSMEAELAVYEHKDPKYSALGQQLIDAGFVPGTPEFQAEMRKHLEADVKGKSKGSGNVTIGAINTGVPIDPKKTGEAAGTEVGKKIGNIEDQYSARDSIGEAITKLDKGIFAGLYGPETMAVAKATSKNNPKVINTEEFMSYIGNVVIPRLKDFGGNDSEEELKYLQKVIGGNQRLEPASIKNILRSAERKINRNIERIQRQSQAAATGAPAPLDAGPSRAADSGGWSIKRKAP